MPPLKELLTIEEVSQRLCLSMSAVRHYIETGVLHAKKYWGEYKIHIEDLRDFVESYDLKPDEE